MSKPGHIFTGSLAFCTFFPAFCSFFYWAVCSFLIDFPDWSVRFLNVKEICLCSAMKCGTCCASAPPRQPIDGGAREALPLPHNVALEHLAILSNQVKSWHWGLWGLHGTSAVPWEWGWPRWGAHCGCVRTWVSVCGWSVYEHGAGERVWVEAMGTWPAFSFLKSNVTSAWMSRSEVAWVACLLSAGGERRGTE